MDSYLNLRHVIRKRNLLAHISIWTITAIVLLVSLTLFKGNLFGLIYLIFFLKFVLLFQSSYSLWARSIKTYCVLLLIYSTGISIATYSFQYETVNSLYKQVFSPAVLNDIGLVVRNQGLTVFLEPFVPVLLSLLLFLYLKIFRDDFNRFVYLAAEDDTSLSAPLTENPGSPSTNDPTFIMLTTNVNQPLSSSQTIAPTPPPPTHPSDTSRAGSTTNLAPIQAPRDLRKNNGKLRFKRIITNTISCFWRIVRIHFIKLVAFLVFRLAVTDVCLMNLPFLILVIFLLKYPSTTKCTCLSASWFISLIVIVRNVSNLSTMRQYDITNKCSELVPAPLGNQTFSFLNYIGLNHDTGNPLNRVDHHIFVLLLLTFYSFIGVHCGKKNERDLELSHGVIFTGIGRREADLGLINTIKYFCNFGFYKFGIETTCLVLIVAIAYRLDIVAAVYAIILILLGIITSKRVLYSIWPFIYIIVSLLIPLQYLLRLGLPPTMCQVYPWQSMSPDITSWFFLPDYLTPPDVTLLLFDFLVLLVIARQSVVFNHMSINANQVVTTSSQTHQNLPSFQFRVKYLPNIEEYVPRDCFSDYSTQNNYLKSIFFMSIYWITLTVVLVAGATKISMFSLGYLIGCFIFLWLGNDAYLMQTNRLITSWNIFILYATLVTFIKVILQLYTCYSFSYLISHCYILQLLHTTCYKKMESNQLTPMEVNQCASVLTYDSLDVLWDGLCLMFLLMQRVVFGSQYFRYLVQEVKAQQILASRGAELIMATKVEEGKAQNSYEKEVMKRIRERMEDLKSNNEHIARAWKQLVALPHHHQVIRNVGKNVFTDQDDEHLSVFRTDDWKSKKAFIPDPIGDELERMAEINGISVVFTRYMKGQPLYGSMYQNSSQSTSSPVTSAENPPDEQEAKLEGLEESVVDINESITETEEGTAICKVPNWWNTLALIVYSCLLSATVELNKLSRSYRYVLRNMAEEKNTLKKRFNLGDTRFKTDPGWRKWVISTLSGSYGIRARRDEESNTSLHRIRSVVKMATNNGGSQDGNQTQDFDNIQSSPSHKHHSELADPEYYFLKLNMFTQFCRALGYVFVSNTSLLCQLMIIFNQVVTASVLSLPLPLMTFLWGTLSVPRPTKRFWKTVITYTEIVIVIKYVCQFPVWSWEVKSYYVSLLGIKNITIIYDLILLLTLFLHRSMLKSLGQWDASGIEDALPFEKPDTNDRQDPASRSVSQPASPERSLQQDNKQESYQNQEVVEKVMESGEVIEERINMPHGSRCSCCSCIGSFYQRVKRSVTVFFHHVLNTPYKVQTDVYTWMFICDFINFLILIYGFWAFGGGYSNQTVTSFLNENRIPFSVLIMLLAQFASIIIDRAFYLQKNMTGKIMFQVVLVIGIHLWLFFIIPFVTGHTLTLKENWPPKAWYVFKCFYFLLSAHQIRSGYPRRVLGNCFAKGFGYANWGAFKIYRAVPLVYDLRLYMDWIWTETTLEFRNWSIMEDAFANLFIRKCELTLEEEYPLPRAKPIRRMSKYLTGGAFILLILAIIWGPLLLFSMGKTVGGSNPPVEIEYELGFVGFQPILRMRATNQQIIILDQSQLTLMSSNFTTQSSRSFLDDYKVGDVAAMRLDGQSNIIWEISPPSKDLLMSRIKNNDTLTLKSSWTVFRTKKQKSQNFDVDISGSYQSIIGNTSQAFRDALYDMLANSSTTLDSAMDAKYVITPPIFPNYIRVPETGQSSLVEQLSDNFNLTGVLRPLNLSYIRMYDTSIDKVSNSTSWWKAEDLCKFHPNNNSYPFWSEDILEHCDSLVMVTFNDRIFTGILALLSAPGILGLYTTFVVFFARLIRTEPSWRVIYTEIPNVDRVYGLIMDIYMMRECGEFELEEKLFAQLLFLYRSPEMLIKYSKREEALQVENGSAAD